MNMVFDCDEEPRDKLHVCENAQGHIWFEINASASDIPSIRLTQPDARKLAHAILAEIGDAP